MLNETKLREIIRTVSSVQFPQWKSAVGESDCFDASTSALAYLALLNEVQNGNINLDHALLNESLFSNLNSERIKMTCENYLRMMNDGLLSNRELSQFTLPDMQNHLASLFEIISGTNGAEDQKKILRVLSGSDLLETENKIIPLSSKKVAVIGKTSVKKEELISVGKKKGISRKRLIFFTNYNDIKSRNFESMRWNQTYGAILFGPVPHSGHGKGDSSSLITMFEKANGYPRVERLLSGFELKITKSNFRMKLQQLIDEGVIEPDLVI